MAGRERPISKTPGLGGGLFFWIVKIEEGAAGAVKISPIFYFYLHEDHPAGGHIVDRGAAKCIRKMGDARIMRAHDDLVESFILPCDDLQDLPGTGKVEFGLALNEFDWITDFASDDPHRLARSSRGTGQDHRWPPATVNHAPRHDRGIPLTALVEWPVMIGQGRVAVCGLGVS